MAAWKEAVALPAVGATREETTEDYA